ncbi:hypothetical protein F66182_586 [Fusarium sp. NRRL 66182]|nr:hypothetical protein F66182_586 [Fusarium sp. NRRL 66182]
MEIQGTREQPFDVSDDDEQPGLTVDDLPLGTQSEDDRKSAINICHLFNKKHSSMPETVQNSLLQLLKSGVFHHTASSVHKPKHHQIYKQMWNDATHLPIWLNITYENWFILVGVFGHDKMAKSAFRGVKDAVAARYRGRMAENLEWTNYPMDDGEHAGELVAQLCEELAALKREVQGLKAQNDAQQNDIDSLCRCVRGQSHTASVGEEQEQERDHKEDEEGGESDDDGEFLQELGMDVG